MRGRINGLFDPSLMSGNCETRSWKRSRGSGELTSQSRPEGLHARAANQQSSPVARAPIQAGLSGFPRRHRRALQVTPDSRSQGFLEECRSAYLRAECKVHIAYQANDRQRPIAARTPTRNKVGLPPARITFRSLNNSYKFTPAVFSSWMCILRRVDGSVLGCLGRDGSLTHRLRREAPSRGLDPARLAIAGPLPLADAAQ